MSDDRVALTTGANSGIGLATALELARRGMRSVGTVRSRAKAAVVSKAAESMGLTIETAILDVTDAESCERVVRKYRPTVIVNNAGFSITGAIEDVGDDEARAALETMVVGPMRLARLALPHMRKVHDGRIINVSSIYGRATTPLTGWYQASKHALEGVSDALRSEVAGDGIKVVLVEPGFVRTGIWAELDGEISRAPGFELRPVVPAAPGQHPDRRPDHDGSGQGGQRHCPCRHLPESTGPVSGRLRCAAGGRPADMGAYADLGSGGPDGSGPVVRLFLSRLERRYPRFLTGMCGRFGSFGLDADPDPSRTDAPRPTKVCVDDSRVTGFHLQFHRLEGGRASGRCSAGSAQDVDAKDA